ncbi:MAG: AAA family ATPase [Bacteroidales bacterium]|nr:AAA family ATPase [Bacteroidales bacterium]
MKPIIKILNNDNNSNRDSSTVSNQLHELISNEVNKERYTKINDIPSPVNVIAYVNPNDDLLEGCYHQNDTVYVKVSSAFDGNTEIYSLQLALSRLNIVGVVTRILIYIGEKDVNATCEDEGRDIIKYTAVVPKWTLDEVILPETVKKKLLRATKIIENRDIIFNDLGYSRVDKNIKSIVCFYGPAGTGKTITAQAIANYLGKKIVISSYAQIESKYVGEGAQNLRKIFKDTETQDAVLFMDECDSFLSKRIESTEGGSDKHYNRMSNELFQLLEDHSGCIIFATNLLTDIDKAFKSRIVDSIFFPLPDNDGKKKMLRKMCLPEILNSVFPAEKELDSFVQTLDGFSGRDIRKSLLLTLAEASDEVKKNGIDGFIWSIDKFNIGFDDVKKSFSEDTKEEIPLDELQKFTDKRKFCQKQFELAKHAVLVDDGIDDREFLVLQELSEQLLNVSLENREISAELSLEDICDSVKDVSKKRLLIDTAIRVISIDGAVSENEETFVKKLCRLMEFTELEAESFVEYAKSMAAAYSKWISIIENNDDLQDYIA